MYTDSRGKDLPGRLQGSRFLPHELQDDTQLHEKFGPGRYRITARNDRGQLCGPSYVCDIPNEHGQVPLLEERADGEVGGASGSGGVTMRDLLRASEARTSDLAKVFETQLKAAREDRRNDMAFFSEAIKSMVASMVPQASSGGSGEDRMQQFMFKRLDHLEKELREERRHGDDWKTKFLKNGEESSWVTEALTKAPELLAMFKGGGGGDGEKEGKAALLGELHKVKVVRERLEAELQRATRARAELEARARAEPVGAPPAAPPAAPGAPRARAPLHEIDPAAFDELLAGGAELEPDVVRELQGIHAEGQLPEGLVLVLRKHKILP